MPVEDYRRLAAAILADAFRDLAGGTAKQQTAARRFLESPAARFWCEVGGLDSAALARLDMATVKRFFKSRNGAGITQHDEV